MYVVICQHIAKRLAAMGEQVNNIALERNGAVFGPFGTREDAEYYAETQMGNMCDALHIVVEAVT